MQDAGRSPLFISAPVLHVILLAFLVFFLSCSKTGYRQQIMENKRPSNEIIDSFEVESSAAKKAKQHAMSAAAAELVKKIAAKSVKAIKRTGHNRRKKPVTELALGIANR